mmetsp:Transcript_7235/g.21858  ORF Transcript_7235/g.21858 Transcript_7235/m.21858 type:complete len:203 (+) Transcript_7235:755-1363(+)
MAPLGPSPAMVSNDVVMKPSSAWRSCSSRSDTLHSSSSSPRATAPSSHAKKRHSAAPSRRWHARMPASSTSFLCDLSVITGLRLVNTADPTARRGFLARGSPSVPHAPPPPDASAPASRPSVTSCSALCCLAPCSAAAIIPADPVAASTHGRWPSPTHILSCAAHSPYGCTSTPAAARCADTSSVTFPASTKSLAKPLPIRP